MSTHRSESAELHGPEAFLSCRTSGLHRGPWRHPAESAMQPKPQNASNAPQRETNIWGALHYEHETAETQSCKGGLRESDR